MTYCQEKGYKVGDEFVVTRTSHFSKDDVIRLIEDDGSNAPLFELISGLGPSSTLSSYKSPTAYESLNSLELKHNWENAPEGTTHYDTETRIWPWMRNHEGKWFVFNEQRGFWQSYDVRIGEAENFVPIYEQSIPKGVVTSDKLQKLSEESGFQIEFHPDGKIRVWDEVLEQGTAGTLDEVIELAEAKIEYAKVWAKFTWD